MKGITTLLAVLWISSANAETIHIDWAFDPNIYNPPFLFDRTVTALPETFIDQYLIVQVSITSSSITIGPNRLFGDYFCSGCYSFPPYYQFYGYRFQFTDAPNLANVDFDPTYQIHGPANPNLQWSGDTIVLNFYGTTIYASDPLVIDYTFEAAPPSAVPLQPSFISELTGLGILGLLAWCRKRKVAA